MEDTKLLIQHIVPDILMIVVNKLKQFNLDELAASDQMNVLLVICENLLVHTLFCGRDNLSSTNEEVIDHFCLRVKNGIEYRMSTHEGHTQ